MEIKPRSVDISMVPGDRLSITVGIMYKCEIVVESNGELRIYYDDVKCLEL